MASSRQQRAKEQRALEAARLAAFCSRPAIESPIDFSVTDLICFGESTTPSPARYDQTREPRPAVRTASVVGIGCDMIFAPTGCFSMPLVTNKSDPRPIDWMLTSFEELKPLAVVREELLRSAKVKDAEPQPLKAMPTCLFGLSGRRLFPGESPPF